MKTICIYMPTASYQIGGAERVAIMQAIYLSKLGYKITFLTIKPENNSDVFQNLFVGHKNINIVYIGDTAQLHGLLNPHIMSHDIFHEIYYMLSSEFIAHITRQTYSLIITHYAPANMSIPKYINNILILHGTPDSIDIIDKISVENATQLIAVSKSVKSGRQKLLGSTIPITVIHNGIDVNYFKPNRQITESIDVLYVGRHLENKGIQYIIEGVSILEKKYSIYINIKIGGFGPYTNELIKLQKKLKIKSKIQFCGYILDKDIVSTYCSAKLCIFPSTSKEGVLTTMLEAAACGKCIITCNIDGMKDFIKDGFNGITVKPFNSLEIAHCIKDGLENSDKRLFLGKNARKEITSKWSREQSIKKFIQFSKI